MFCLNTFSLASKTNFKGLMNGYIPMFSADFTKGNNFDSLLFPR